MRTRSGQEFGIAEMENNKSDNFSQVNPDYKYTEDDLKLVIKALLRNKGLSLSNMDYGLIVNADQTLHKPTKNQIIVISPPLSISEHKVADMVRLNQFELVIGKMFELFSEHKISTHKVIFPLNVASNHWCLGTLDINLLQHRDEVRIVEIAGIYVYDSMPNKEYIAQLKQQLQRILTKHLLPNKELELYITHKQLGMQPDVTSCGPITADNLMKLINDDENVYKSFDKYAYTPHKLLELRRDQLRITADQDFIARQIANKPDIELAARETNGDIVYLANKLTKYRDSLGDQEVDEFSSICTEFIKIEQYDSTDDIEAERLRVIAKLKTWFNQHQEQVGIEIINQFFKVNHLPAKIDEWHDNGKDTLYAVLKNIFCVEDNQTDFVTSISVKDADYEFIGHINQENLADAVGKEITSKYGEYIGDFESGVKSGYGIETYTVPRFQIVTYFFGSRTNDGKFDVGFIGCFLGSKALDLENESYVFFNGWLDNGMINGIGQLSLYESGRIKYSLSARFSDGSLIKQFESDFPDAEYSICMKHFAKYSKQFELHLEPGLQDELTMIRKRRLVQHAKSIAEETDDQSSTYSNSKRSRPSP